MTENIYIIKNKCPKCETEIDCPYTEEIKCVCTKWNCKHEFQKRLQGVIGITLRQEEDKFIMKDEETGLDANYTNYDQLEKDLDILRQQQTILDGEKNDK